MKLARQTITGLVVAALLASAMVLLAPVAPAEAGGNCSIAGTTIYREGPCTKSNGKCSGNPDGNLYRARLNYRWSCGMHWQYNSGFHRCDWTYKGWTCSGP